MLVAPVDAVMLSWDTDSADVAAWPIWTSGVIGHENLCTVVSARIMPTVTVDWTILISMVCYLIVSLPETEPTALLPTGGASAAHIMRVEWAGAIDIV